MNDKDIISESLDIGFSSSEETSLAIPVTNTDPTKAKEDMEYAKKNIKGLIENGNYAIQEIIKIATAGDSPRAYEVIGQLLKTVSDMNKDLLQLHKTVKEVEKEEITVNNTTNNSIYVGSTSELQDLINQDRSRLKAIKSQKFLDNGVQ
jgi:hypothetical protein